MSCSHYTKPPCLALALLFLPACNSGTTFPAVTGSGVIVTDERYVTGFDAISFSGVGSVTIRQGDNESLTVTADDNILPLLRTEVEGTTLQIDSKDNTSMSPSQEIEYVIELRELNSVTVSGVGSVTASEIDGGYLMVALQGTGNITLSGTVETLDLTLSGTGEFNGEDLQTSTATVSLSGTGNAVVNVSDELDATVTGTGSVEYIGDPTVKERVSGTGSVQQR